MAFLLCSIGLSSRGESKPYKGAEYRTIQSFHFGRFEVRWKSAPGSGLLSSFFTFHDSFNPIAEWNEIDFENLGRYSNQTQYNVITPGQVQHVRADTLPFNPHQAFHEYAIEWTPDYVAWFVDGYETHRQTGPHIQQLIHGQKNMMNIWISDNTSWVGPFNPAILPVYAYYDWVKYYSYTPETSSHFTLQWVDSLEAWDASRWQKASHTWNGNLVDFTPENVVFRDGYLILCLTLPGALGYNGGPVIDQDVDPPYMVWARSYPDKLFLFFSEPVDSVSAQNLNNYILPGFSVTGAKLLNDGRTVRLTVPGIDLNLTLNLLAKDIADLASPPNVMSLSSIKVIPPLPVP
ncbi:MAG: glycosyl hydrolase family protein, partial [Calditrichaeota bacterium]